MSRSIPQFRSAYSEPSRLSDLSDFEPSLTQQSFKDDADINVLLERFKVTGQLPQGVRLPTYGDFTGVSDYRTALDALNTARDSFMAMPADVRARFGNDPQKFLEFCSDPSNLDEARKLGLAVPPPHESPAPAGSPSGTVI